MAKDSEYMRNVTSLQNVAAQYADRAKNMANMFSTLKVGDLTSTIANAVKPMTVNYCPAIR